MLPEEGPCPQTLEEPAEAGAWQGGGLCPWHLTSPVARGRNKDYLGIFLSVDNRRFCFCLLIVVML